MPPRKPSPIGVHVPVAGGLAKAGLAHARLVGAEAVQVFLGNPRGWTRGGGDPVQDALFRDGCAADGLPVFVHAPYLCNLGSPTELTVERSVECLAAAVVRGRAIGARGVVVHAGSEVAGGSRDVAMKQVRASLLPLLDALEDDDPDLLVELTAGGKGSLAATAEGLAEYLAAVDGHPRLGVCVDTCHAHAAGHDLAAPGGMRRFLTGVAKVSGKKRLRLVHANDSKDPVGSTRDRHERIGAGTIGLAPFGELFVHPATTGVPIVLETPGDPGENKHDVALVKGLRADALAR